MPKCKKVKNPCKICLETVTQKTGLKCQGVCECWVHYKCLNFTAGKIKDIKAGVIHIRCPCPDCSTDLPKEFRVDEPFSCSNLRCPANRPPKCANTACPIKDNAPDKMNQTSAVKLPNLDTCGTDCKKNSRPNIPGRVGTTGRAVQNQSVNPVQAPRQRSPLSSQCESGCFSVAEIACDHRRSPNLPNLDTCGTDCQEHSCPNIPCSARTSGRGVQNQGVNPAQCPRQRSALSSKGESCCSSVDEVAGDHKQPAIRGMPSLRALEQMCNTVGQLTNQLNTLMKKMKNVVKDRIESRSGGKGSCFIQKDSKGLCPKPCFCPGNPGGRK